MQNRQSDLLTAAIENIDERTALINQYLDSLSLPIKESAKTLLITINRYDPPSGHRNFTEIFLEAYAKKMQDIYYKAQFQPLSIEQLQNITDHHYKAQAELKIYQLLQIQKNDNLAEATRLTEKLLSKSNNYRKVLCQNPELLTWLVKNSSPTILDEIIKSNITQSQHWSNNIRDRDELEQKIITKYNNPSKFCNQLIKRVESIEDKAQQANISLRVHSELNFLVRNLTLLHNTAELHHFTNEKDLQSFKHTIKTKLNLINGYNRVHLESAQKQSTTQKIGHAITHLRESAKKMLQHSKEQKREKQTKETLENGTKRKSTFGKP